MNLLCPNCQKMLTVPEQFAGQLMQCPLCSGKFTVPALPAGGGSDPAVPTPSAPDRPVSESEISFTPPPIPDASPTPAPAFATGPSEPAFALGSPKVEPRPAEPKPTLAPAPAPTGSFDTGGYSRTVRLAANVAVLQWVPLAAIVLIFFLQFLPWVGVYPGGVPAVTQTAWGAAFGDYSADPDMKKQFRIITPAEAADNNEKKSKDETKEVSNAPGFGPLTFFYLVPFFLVTLVFTIFVAAQPYLTTVRLPPQVEQMLPYKWSILAGLNVILLLFLTLQLLLNFSLESSVTSWIESQAEFKKDKDPSTPEVKQREANLGKALAQIRRTTYLRLAYFLHVVATAAAGLVYWVERRGPGKPLPAVEIKW